jgi:hypothetical protein
VKKDDGKLYQSNKEVGTPKGSTVNVSSSFKDVQLKAQIAIMKKFIHSRKAARK